ncbi:MAG: metal ABC transporter permease [Rubrobacter sp.]
MTWLVEPLRYSFMQTGLLAALIIGTTCAVLGVYVVLRGMAFIGDALSHTVLPGLAASYLLGLNLLAGAVVAGLTMAFGVGWLSRNRTLREDTAIGVAYTGMFALGILMMSTVDSFRDFSHILFGNILGVTNAALIAITLLSATILTLVLLLHKELELTSFDPTHASVIGLKPDRLRYLLLVLLALTVVIGIQAVGVILISALLITPAATASLLTNNLPRMMLLSASVSALASAGGLYASFYLNIPSGAAIVLLCTFSFLLAFTLKSISSRT